MNSSPIDRVLAEIRDSEANGVTAHSTYTSGLFEEPCAPLSRVLAEVRDAEQNGVTAHSTYTSGLFEGA